MTDEMQKSIDQWTEHFQRVEPLVLHMISRGISRDTAYILLELQYVQNRLNAMIPPDEDKWKKEL